MANKMTMSNVDDIRQSFVEKLQEGEFVIDKFGGKVVEIIGAQFIADEESIFTKLNLDYAEREINWYLSQSLEVSSIEGKVPDIWIKTADKNGKINSNYGWVIYSQANYSQFENVLAELVKNPFSRRAVMIYNRPSMWYDYQKDGMNDFMCTHSVQYFIRDKQLHCIVNMRSNDAVFGYKNDKYWQDWVHETLLRHLQLRGVKIELGGMIWNVGSIHVYERHFKDIQKYIDTGEWK